tara:strand:+ start:247 stop:510 length:264 start_codon:yes stop_codon:yes gene_type:complete
MPESKTVRKGQVVAIRKDTVSRGPWTGLLERSGVVVAMNVRLPGLFTVLTHPKMIVNDGHEHLVVDLLDDDGDIKEDFAVCFLEVVT